MQPLETLALFALALLLSRLIALPFRRHGAPSILAELLLGFLIGNWLIGPQQVLAIGSLAELGVLVLFFSVGLQTDVREIVPFRNDMLRMVSIGTVAPVLLLVLLAPLLPVSMGEMPFVVATVMTTGVGVAVRVLGEYGFVATPSGRMIIGASVVDDFPAIFFLALASGLAGASGLSASLLVGVAGQSLLLLGAVVLIWASTCGKLPKLDRLLGRMSAPAVLALLALGAWASEQAGLTALLGAFVLGLLCRRSQGPLLERYIAPLADLCVPIFFLTVGMRVSATALAAPESWWLAGLLLVVAFASKFAGIVGIGPASRAAGVDPLLVTFGMFPRGLPGLVFATVALNSGYITAATFSALIVLVAATNIVGLTLMGLRIKALQGSGSARPVAPWAGSEVAVPVRKQG